MASRGRFVGPVQIGDVIRGFARTLELRAMDADSIEDTGALVNVAGAIRHGLTMRHRAKKVKQ